MCHSAGLRGLFFELVAHGGFVCSKPGIEAFVAGRRGYAIFWMVEIWHYVQQVGVDTWAGSMDAGPPERPGQEPGARQEPWAHQSGMNCVPEKICPSPDPWYL